MTVANLFARIGLKADVGEGQKVRQLLGNLLGDLKALTFGMAGFTTSITLSMKAALANAAAYREFAAQTGASVEELQRWQNVAAGANVSTQAIADSVKELSSNREKIKLGQGNFSGFAFLGINPMDDPFKILDQLRTKTAGLPPAMKANLLSMMGVSTQFLQVLNLTDGEFRRLKDDAFVIPKSAIDALGRTQSNLNQLGQMVKWFQALLGERLAPVIDRLVKSITLWVQQNKNGLIKGITDVTKWVISFLGAIINVATWLGKLIGGTIGWKAAMDGLLIAILYFNRALLFSPIGMIIAGVTLLVLLLDDLHAALHIDGDNRNSLFGKIFEKNPAIKKLFEDTFGFLKDLGKLLKDLSTGDLFDVAKITAKWGLFGDAIKIVIGFITQVKQLLSDIFSGNWGDILKNQTGNGTWSKLGLGDKDITNFLLGLFGQKQIPADRTPAQDDAGVLAAAKAANGGGAVVVTQNNSISVGDSRGMTPADLDAFKKKIAKASKDALEVEANRRKTK